MTEPIPDAPDVDFTSLHAEDAPPIIPEKPDHTASRSKKWGRKRDKPAGDQRDTSRPKSRSPKRVIPNRKGQFREPLEQFYTAIGVTLMPFDPVCANAVIAAAPNCADTLDELAYRNESFRRIIFAIVNTSAIGAVIAAHLPILLAVAMHHIPSVQNVLGIRGMEFAQNVAGNMQENGTPDGGSNDAEAA